MGDHTYTRDAPRLIRRWSGRFGRFGLVIQAHWTGIRGGIVYLGPGTWTQWTKHATRLSLSPDDCVTAEEVIRHLDQQIDELTRLRGKVVGAFEAANRLRWSGDS